MQSKKRRCRLVNFMIFVVGIRWKRYANVGKNRRYFFVEIADLFGEKTGLTGNIVRKRKKRYEKRHNL